MIGDTDFTTCFRLDIIKDTIISKLDIFPRRAKPNYFSMDTILFLETIVSLYNHPRLLHMEETFSRSL